MTRLLLQAIAIFIAMIAGLAGAQEQIAPLAADQVVIIVSPSGPGSSIDAMARTYAGIASRYTSQKFVFDNRTGAAGLIATNYVLDQPANGFTLQAFTRATTLNFLTQPHTDNPLGKYYYVGITMFTPVIVYTYKGGPYADAQQLIAEAKARPASASLGRSFGRRHRMAHGEPHLAEAWRERQVRCVQGRRRAAFWQCSANTFQLGPAT